MRSTAYLQLDPLAVHLDGLDLEVDADGGDEGGAEAVVGVAQQQARLAHAYTRAENGAGDGQCLPLNGNSRAQLGE